MTGAAVVLLAAPPGGALPGAEPGGSEPGGEPGDEAAGNEVGAPLRIGPCVRYSKADAFEICAALALAESVLRSLGRETDAALVAAVFEVAEAGLVR